MQWQLLPGKYQDLCMPGVEAVPGLCPGPASALSSTNPAASPEGCRALTTLPCRADYSLLGGEGAEGSSRQQPWGWVGSHEEPLTSSCSAGAAGREQVPGESGPQGARGQVGSANPPPAGPQRAEAFLSCGTKPPAPAAARQLQLSLSLHRGRLGLGSTARGKCIGTAREEQQGGAGPGPCLLQLGCTLGTDRHRNHQCRYLLLGTAWVPAAGHCTEPFQHLPAPGTCQRLKQQHQAPAREAGQSLPSQAPPGRSLQHHQPPEGQDCQTGEEGTRRLQSLQRCSRCELSLRPGRTGTVQPWGRGHLPPVFEGSHEGRGWQQGRGWARCPLAPPRLGHSALGSSPFAGSSPPSRQNHSRSPSAPPRCCLLRKLPLLSREHGWWGGGGGRKTTATDNLRMALGYQVPWHHLALAGDSSRITSTRQGDELGNGLK